MTPEERTRMYAATCRCCLLAAAMRDCARCVLNVLEAEQPLVPFPASVLGDFCGNCGERWPCVCDNPHQMCGVCAGDLAHDCHCSERDYVESVWQPATPADATRASYGEGPEDGWYAEMEARNRDANDLRATEEGARS